jgi:hypothetical protein
MQQLEEYSPGPIRNDPGAPVNVTFLAQLTEPVRSNTTPGEGIYRSIDTGITWTKVSSVNPQTRIPVLFQGRHYLGTATGLLVLLPREPDYLTRNAVSLIIGDLHGTAPAAATTAHLHLRNSHRRKTRFPLVRPVHGSLVAPRP